MYLKNLFNKNNIFLIVMLIPFILTYIIPFFLIGSRYNNFQIGGSSMQITSNDLSKVILMITICLLSYISLFLKRKLICIKNKKFIYPISLIKIIIIFSIIGLVRHLDYFIYFPSFTKQIFIPLSYLSLIGVALCNNQKLKFFYIFLIILVIDCLLTLIFTSITRDIITKILILLLVMNYKLINIKNLIIFIFIFFFIFFIKDFLRNKADDFIKIESISIHDYLISENLAKYLNINYLQNNKYSDSQILFKMSNQYNLYDSYKDYFKRLDMYVNRLPDELYLENYTDIYSLCNVNDVNCLTFFDFVRRLVNLSINKEIEYNNFSNPLDRFNKVSNLIFYNDKFKKKEIDHLGFNLYYPQIYTILPIPRFLWKEKPENLNGELIGSYFNYNTSKSGFIAWYEPLLIELFICFGSIGLLIYTIFNFLTVLIIKNIKLNIYNNFGNLIFFVGLLKFYFDYQIQGFIESLGGFIYFLFIIFSIKLTTEIILKNNINNNKF